jgi:hypothetical protein
MTNEDELYASWMIKGSYFNLMLDCGERYNQWIENALHYLPREVLNKHKENLVFISTAERDACRIARHYCESREVIILSDRILPKQNANEGQPEVRYFIFTVLHEIAHATKKHKSKKFDNLTEQETQAQEDEANIMALEWFNQYVEEQDSPFLKPLTMEKIAIGKQKNVDLIEKLYSGA